MSIIYSFFNFLNNKPSLFAITLTLGVIFVNGWTDAPNAITGCVCSKALKMRSAVIIAAVCNLLGTVISSVFFPNVAKNIFETAGIFDSGALCASLLSVIILAVGAWFFGIPTSESHAIIASITGASLACGSGISIKLILLTVFGLIISVIGGFIAGFWIYSILRKKQIKNKNLRYFQIVSTCFMAFMHGAQDGQKFISILLLASGNKSFNVPIGVVVISSVVMALGTLTGGKRIIDKVGQKMVSIDAKQSVSADIAGTISLFVSTVLGMPVSTTHAKTSAIMGCGYSGNKLNKKTAQQMIAAWLITFPVCFVLGFILTKLFK